MSRSTPAPAPRPAIARSLLRSFLVQGSWNYRTMLGCGFAFALLPALRRLFGASPAALDAATRRHLELFNAHPYLVGIALGAVLRLEAEGADPETIRRFKLAVRGPLGSLGDALVWAAWLPALSLLALAVYWLGAPGWLAVAGFLVVYNVGHVGLRLWGFRVGLEGGLDVGVLLRNADLGRWTARLRAVVALLLGVVAGALLAGDRALAGAGAGWAAVAAAAFVVGLAVGHRAWRPAAATVVAAIALLAALGQT
ncbi:MAG TPA: PTS system mannose/fructose/sorbose family transporter subunit IID [Longimicrobiales bacterium]|nr:PTS system mannose/fructose/sorbose family transporter subunit IID [Longimicrobiales bacterium]